VSTEWMLDVNAITDVMARPSGTRPVFHSEADFQQTLGWAVHEAWLQHQVRLETDRARESISTRS
jgi:hypothetical protein